MRYLEALSDECIDYLLTVVRAKDERVEHRVSAARVIVEEHRWCADREEKPMLDLQAVLGDDSRALAWMLEKVPELQARIAARAKELTDGRADEASEPADRGADPDRDGAGA